MTQEPAHPATHLFPVRIWLEVLDNGQAEWRGRVQHVLTGERRHFRNWPALIAHLLAMV